MGSCRFEAIYFSATAESCAVAAGMRVDAAFYLQANTFRGQTTLQLQIIDLRPSLTPSRHEAEALELVARCCQGGPLTERERTRLPAQREPFAACYTALERQLKRTGAESAPELPLLRLLAAESGGATASSGRPWPCGSSGSGDWSRSPRGRTASSPCASPAPPGRWTSLPARTSGG